MANFINVMNTIKAKASPQYQDRVPTATQENIEDIRYVMIDGDNIAIANEFVHTLINKIVKSILITKMFENPLKSLKKGKKPLGDTVEEIYTNFLKASVYNDDATDLFKRALPDTKTVYHRTNRKEMYEITVSRDELSRAFKSWAALENYVQSLIERLYSSAELDEFLHTKQLLKSAVDNKAVVVIPTSDPLGGKEAATDFIKTVKTVSGLMAFPSTAYNAYLTAQDVDTVPITTFTRKSEQVLILDTATDVSVDVDVLASIFNMSVAEFNDTKKIVIDHFPDENMRAALVDEQFFQIFDDLYTVTNFKNPKSLYDSYYLHVWQTLAYSILVNAVVFSVEDEAATTEE